MSEALPEDLEDLARLREQPERIERLRARASAPVGPIVRALLLAGAACLAFALLALVGALLAASLCPPFGLVPLLVFGIGLWAAGRQLRLAVRAWRAPLEARLARVLAPAEEEARSEGVRLVLEDGRALELNASASLLRSLAAGDRGLALVRGAWLLGFERLS